MIETKFKKRIPDGWEVKQLNQVLSLFGRIGFRGYNVTDLVQEGKGAISLSPSNIENGIVTFNKCTYLSWEKYEESPEIMVEEGDILLVKTGSTYGKIGYVESLPWPSTINPQYVVLKKFKCNSRVLAYLLEQKDFQDQIESITSGGAIPTMSQAKILNCTVTLPPEKEQSRIAEALSDIDDLIAITKKLIEKKRNIKEGAMQELLSGKRRLPGFKEKWVETTLGEICQITMGQSPASEYYNTKGDGLPLIQGNADLNNRKSIIRFYSSCYSKCCDAGDIIMSVRAPVGSIGRAQYKSCLGRGVCALKYENDFLYYYLISIENTWSASSTGSIFDSINSKEVLETVISIPHTKGEQIAIAKILSDMDDEISMLESRLTKYQSLKQGMMQQLLTGKIRLI